jgi:hypothetical protein
LNPGICLDGWASAVLAEADGRVILGHDERGGISGRWYKKMRVSDY